MTTTPQTAEYGSKVAKENLSIHTTLETTRRASHGQSFKTLEEARARFDAIANLANS